MSESRHSITKTTGSIPPHASREIRFDFPYLKDRVTSGEDYTAQVGIADSPGNGHGLLIQGQPHKDIQGVTVTVQNDSDKFTEQSICCAITVGG